MYVCIGTHSYMSGKTRVRFNIDSDRRPHASNYVLRFQSTTTTTNNNNNNHNNNEYDHTINDSTNATANNNNNNADVSFGILRIEGRPSSNPPLTDIIYIYIYVLYIYMCTYIHRYMYVYIYIYREREI